MSATGLPPDFLSRLDGLLGPGGLLTDEADCAPYGIDWRRLFPGRAAAVARPSSTGQVASVVGLCREAGEIGRAHV